MRCRTLRVGVRLDGKRDVAEGGISVKAEDLEADLFVYRCGGESWTDWRTKALPHHSLNSDEARLEFQNF